MNIRPEGAELFHADGRTNVQTDMTKLIVAFRNFANAPKGEKACYACFISGEQSSLFYFLAIRVPYFIFNHPLTPSCKMRTPVHVFLYNVGHISAPLRGFATLTP
jgi:hypothetical protein